LMLWKRLRLETLKCFGIIVRSIKDRLDVQAQENCSKCVSY